MTTAERAAKIHAETCALEDPRVEADCIAYIAAEINDAVERAVYEEQARYRPIMDSLIDRNVSLIRAEALEEAARLISSDAKLCGDKETIRVAKIWVNEIRALIPKEKP